MTWSDILTGIALVLVIEGLAYALAPSLIERALAAMRDIPLPSRRIMGLAVAAAGVGLLWLIRGFGAS